MLKERGMRGAGFPATVAAVLAAASAVSACNGGASPIRADGASDGPVQEVAAETSTSTDAGPEVDPACATIAADATRTVHLTITADNECDVFVNGTKAGSTTSWSSPVTLDVSLFVHPSKRNVIAVKANNTSSQDGNDRGILGQLVSLSDGGSSLVLVTDEIWKTSKTEMTGWSDLDFDDSAWSAATVIASHGDPPWGALFGQSTAKWIWSALVPVATADKPDLETAYARRTFFFTTDGAGITDAPGCPAPTAP